MNDFIEEYKYHMRKGAPERRWYFMMLAILILAVVILVAGVITLVSQLRGGGTLVLPIISLVFGLGLMGFFIWFCKR